MIEIFADHPIASSVYYRFCFKDTHEDSEEMLNGSIRDFKMYISAEQQANSIGTVVFLSTGPTGSPFKKHIITWMSMSDRDAERLCVNVDIADTDIWYKWLVWLECKYRLYSPPSKSDLMEFLQEVPEC